ncbi:MAG: SDR family NAD(P)-dependent oxidoreductase [Pseudomonadales bacterium]|nr:SDR family oxidoreductase [Gammaproteobacteria bacterium]MDG1231647.1 SDR family NAD(P)-dependent oxidoreductase [Pseudomonadales bacterium]
MSKLEGKVALITGAGSGIGRASAIHMAQAGAAVMCSDIDSQAAEGTVALINEAGGRADGMGLDVTSAQEMQEAMKRTISNLGDINVLFNNAGVGSGFGWDQTIAVNLTGVFHGLSIGAPLLAERGGGVIINTASIAGMIALMTPPVDEDDEAEADPDAEAGIGAYVAAKHGVVGLTKQFAINYGSQGVRVNAIAPGFIVTPMTAEFRAEQEGEDFLIDLTPMGRLGQPEEIASVATFLASSDASFINGITLPVDGGYTAR